MLHAILFFFHYTSLYAKFQTLFQISFDRHHFPLNADTAKPHHSLSYLLARYNLIPG